MAESTGAKQKEKPTKSSVRPVRERLVRKQLVSARRGATINELAEDQVKGGGILQQRAAVRPVSGDAVSRASASTESRFAHDFSRIPAHTVAPQTGPVGQAKLTTGKPLTTGEPLTVNAPGDQYEQEADQVARAVMCMPESPVQRRDVTVEPIHAHDVTVETISAGEATTWARWLLHTEDGQEYGRLRTSLERKGYWFILKARTPGGTWDRQSLRDDTPISDVGWSILTLEGWTWATPANIVAECRRLDDIPEIQLETRPPITGANVAPPYPIREPVLARVPDHFLPDRRGGTRFAGITRDPITVGEKLARNVTWRDMQPMPVREGIYVVNDIPWGSSHLRVTLPSWEGFEHANEFEKHEWNRFMRCVRIHEQGHVDIVNNFFSNLQPEQRTIRGPDFAALQARLLALEASFRALLDADHHIYDQQTGHGMGTQDAVLRPPHVRTPP